MRWTPKTAFAVGLMAGAAVMLASLAAVARVDQCSGFSAHGFRSLDVWNCSEIGPYRLYRGIWVDGFEEARFFPDATSLPNSIPETDARLLIDEAAKQFVRERASPNQAGLVREVFQIEFWGNELRPYRSSLYRRLFAVRRIKSTRVIRQERAIK